jgi:hypothetical protein
MLWAAGFHEVRMPLRSLLKTASCVPLNTSARCSRVGLTESHLLRLRRILVKRPDSRRSQRQCELLSIIGKNVGGQGSEVGRRHKPEKARAIHNE